MFAVVKIHSPTPLESEAFFSGVPAKGTLAICIERSRYHRTPEVIGDVVHFDAGPTGVTIVVQDGPNSYQAHVENSRDSTCMPHLKMLAEDALRTMTDAAKRLKLKIDFQRIEIYAEESLIQVGSTVSYWSFIQKQFVDKLLSQFLAAIGVAVVSWAYSQKKEEAVAAFLIASVALFARTCLEAAIYRRQIYYDDA